MAILFARQKGWPVLSIAAPVLMAIVLVPTSLCAGSVYRWVDAQGQVHYGDHPPAGAKVESVPPPFPPGTGEAQRELYDYVRRLDVQNAERAQEAEQQRQQKELETARKAECQSSRERRARLERPRQLEYQADGSARRLTEEERQARIQEMEKRITGACK